MKEDQSRAERVRLQMFLARRTEDLNTWRAELNQRLDLEQR